METCSFQSKLYLQLLSFPALSFTIKKKEYKDARNLTFKCLMNDRIKDTETFSPFLPPPAFSFQLPTIYPDHVWHMAATDLHASIMLDAIVLEGRRERE